MDFEYGLIDASYDRFFCSLSNFPLYPWIGSNFRSSPSRVYLLGESNYRWADTHDVDIQLSNKLFTRYVVAHQGTFHLSNWKGNNGKKYKLFRNTEKLISGEASMSDKKREMFWTTKAYSNLVSRIMYNRNDRPTPLDYAEGWASHFKVFRELQVDQVVVLGLEWPKRKAFMQACVEYDHLPMVWANTKIGKSTPSFSVIKFAEGIETKFYFTKHPSGYFPWKQWNRFLLQNNFH